MFIANAGVWAPPSASSQRVPTITGLGLPRVLEELAMKPRGLIPVTGPTGSESQPQFGSHENYINPNRSCHILTLEELIEYSAQYRKAWSINGRSARRLSWRTFLRCIA